MLVVELPRPIAPGWSPRPRIAARRRIQGLAHILRVRDASRKRAAIRESFTLAMRRQLAHGYGTLRMDFVRPSGPRRVTVAAGQFVSKASQAWQVVARPLGCGVCS